MTASATNGAAEPPADTEAEVAERTGRTAKADTGSVSAEAADETSRPAQKPSLGVRAVLLGERIPFMKRERERAIALGPTVIRVGDEAFAVLFRYGAVVFFGVSLTEETAFLRSLAEGSEAGLNVLESEENRIEIDSDARDDIGRAGEIILKDRSPERLQVVADVLAKSTVLNYHEARMAAAFDRIEPLAATMRLGKRMRGQSRELLKHIGDVLRTEHRMVGRVEVVESPEVLWENPELERLYLRLVDEYDLRERDRALTRKLNLIYRTVTTVLDIIQNSRSLRVEWYIVILIVIEILLTLYKMISPGG